MFAQQLAGAISHARSPQQFDQLARDVWRAHASGILSDDEAQAAAESIHAKKQTVTLAGGFKNASSGFLRARRQRSPDKIASIERRRRLARASPVPPELVDQFTQGEHAVIAVVAGEIQRVGQCTWPLARIAAISGVCVTLVRTAIRRARSVGLLFSIERRRRGQKSLTNIVRVLRREWGVWLKRIGRRKLESTSDKILRTRENGAAEGPKRESGGIGIARTVPRGGP